MIVGRGRDCFPMSSNISSYVYLISFRFQRTSRLDIEAWDKIYPNCFLSGLNRLSACESNKDKIVQRGILNLYNKLLTGPSSEEEQLLVAQGLWLLSFHPGVRHTILEESTCLQGEYL